MTSVNEWCEMLTSKFNGVGMCDRLQYEEQLRKVLLSDLFEERQ